MFSALPAGSALLPYLTLGAQGVQGAEELSRGTPDPWEGRPAEA